MFSRKLMLTIINCWPALLILMLLSGCGGGSSGSATGAFSLSQTTLSLSGYQHLLNSSRQDITMTITGDGVTYAGAAYASGQLPVNWLQFDLAGSGKNYVLSVTILPHLMGTGKSNAAFTVGTSDAKGNILASQVVTVNADLWLGMQTNSTEKNELKMYGAVEQTLTFPLTFTADNRTNWQVSSSHSWLTINQSTGQGGASLTGSVDTSLLAPGDHQAEVTIQDTQVSNHKLRFIYRLQLDAPRFEFYGEDGVLGAGTELNTVPLQFAVRTGQYSHPYQLSFDTDNGIAWLTADEAEGMVNEAGKTLQIRSVAGDDMEGTFAASARLRMTVGELAFEQTIRITLHKELNRFSMGAMAVAFSSAPDKALLSRQVPVIHSLNRTDLTWQAVSDASWLTVTAAGNMGQSISLQADPTGLAADQTYYATVTVHPDSASVGNSEQIRVALSVLSTIPQTHTLSLPRTDSTYQDKIFRAVSPLQPVIMIGYGNTLSAYNIYTAEPLYTVGNTVAAIGGITYSADGSKLFIYDPVLLKIVVLDANSAVELASYPLDNMFIETMGLVHIKQNGKNMLLGVPGQVYATDSGQRLPLATDSIAPAGRSLDAGYSPQLVVNESGQLFNISYSALNGGEVVSVNSYNSGHVTGNAGQACFEPTGHYVFTASGSPYDFTGYNLHTKVTDKILPGQAYPNAIVCAADGLIIGGTQALYSANDIYLYAADGSALGMLNSAAEPNTYRRLVNRGLSVSSDASQLIAVTEREGATQIKFMRLPASP